MIDVGMDERKPKKPPRPVMQGRRLEEHLAAVAEEVANEQALREADERIERRRALRGQPDLRGDSVRH